MKCYDPQGVEHNKEPVDAKECVKVLGWTLEPPVIEKSVEPEIESKIEEPVKVESVEPEKTEVKHTKK